MMVVRCSGFCLRIVFNPLILILSSRLLLHLCGSWSCDDTACWGFHACWTELLYHHASFLCELTGTGEFAEEPFRKTTAELNRKNIAAVMMVVGGTGFCLRVVFKSLILTSRLLFDFCRSWYCDDIACWDFHLFWAELLFCHVS